MLTVQGPLQLITEKLLLPTKPPVRKLYNIHLVQVYTDCDLKNRAM